MNIVATITFCLLALLSGWLVLELVWAEGLDSNDCGNLRRPLLLLKIVMASGIGIGLSSCLWFLCMLSCSSLAWAPLAVQIGFVFLAILVLWKRRHAANGIAGDAVASIAPGVDTGIQNADDLTTGLGIAVQNADGIKSVSRSFIGERILKPSSFLVMAISIGFFVLLTLIHPFGDWDALMIWNLHAKFLFAGNAHWQDAFSNLIFWSHPDYPLLVSGFIACCWRLYGTSAALIPELLSFLFFAATISLTYLLVLIAKGKVQALWALALLVSTPNFIEQSANQCADVPVGFFILSSFACILLADKFPRARARLFLTAGLSAGLAAWTKNEGLLFVCVFALVHFVLTFRNKQSLVQWKERTNLFVGALPVMAIVFYFKHLVPQNDIVGPQNFQGTVAALTDLSRYVVIVEHFVLQSVLFGEWIMSPVLVVWVFWFCVPRVPNLVRNQSVCTVALTLALLVFGYFCVYLLMPLDVPTIAQRLTFSLDRLFVGLWPSTLVLLFSTMDLEGAGRVKNVDKTTSD